MTAAIARLKITLDDVEPAVIRRVEAPFDIRLDRLHLLIQAGMGWTNSHLYEIRAGDVGWGIPDPGWPDGPLDARKARLADVIEDVGTKTLRYVYDFGDGWEHTIKIERLGDPEPGITYPRLIEASGRCPPEDVGGPWGYGELLEAIADPKHERHRVKGVDRRRLRSACRRCQMARRRGRSLRQEMVAQAGLQAPVPRLTAVLTGWSPTTFAWRRSSGWPPHHRYPSASANKRSDKNSRLREQQIPSPNTELAAFSRIVSLVAVQASALDWELRHMLRYSR